VALALIAYEEVLAEDIEPLREDCDDEDDGEA
jgi:hypothetical protein